MVLCPYCGSLSHDLKVCSTCGGHFDMLSRQRSQNAMGPWFIRDQNKPFQPGCSYATLVRLVAAGRIKPETVLRGPSTRQFWTFARNTPGLANLLGACHACHAVVAKTATSCPSCKANFVIESDRQNLGLSPVHLLPGEADPETIARAIGGAPAAKPDPAPVNPTPHPKPTPASRSDAPKVQASTPTEKERATPAEPSGGLSPLVWAVGLFVVMMVGAGAWAWSYLHRPAEVAQSSNPPPPPPPAAAPAPVEADISESPPDTVPEPVPEPEPVVAEAPPEKSPEPEPEIEPPTPPDTAAYDRVLIGIVDGRLTDETAFQQAIESLSESDRERLTLLRQRRQSQLHLGR
ncbi:MAG TPA: hypothetical protein ENJ00_08025 [Phycisphaerales bacterium]|nr:hypothetical protein [Phycisphaerales bacterium]